MHAVVEARRAAPAVLYLPHLQLWCPHSAHFPPGKRSRTPLVCRTNLNLADHRAQIGSCLILLLLACWEPPPQGAA